MPDDPYDPYPALETLVEHGVRFVIIGGVAAQLLGAPVATFDIDICYARDRENLDVLAEALRELDARRRGAPDNVPFRLDARTLEAGDHFTFATEAGPLDILGTPAGAEGYDALASASRRVRVREIEVLIASLEDLMRMKKASGRTKDLLMLEELAALRDRLDERGGI